MLNSVNSTFCCWRQSADAREGNSRDEIEGVYIMYIYYENNFGRCTVGDDLLYLA